MLQDPKDNELEKRVRNLEKVVSALRSAEKTARTQLAELEQIFQTVTDGVMVIDTDFKVLRMNEAFSKIAGVSAQDAVGKKCFKIFPGLFCYTSDCPLVRILNGVDHLEYEGQQHRKDGIATPCIITARAIKGQNGEIVGIVEDIKDISGLKRTQAQLQQSFDRFRKTMGGIIQAMSLTIEKRDPYTAGHQRRVAKLCRAIATEMDFSWERVQGIRMAAAIHDLGKIHVPAAILSRPGSLSENEFGIIKTHPQTAYDILKGIEFPWPIAKTIWQHHERMDGSGYPKGLAAKDIILEARILAVADVVEAMSSFRPYRMPLGIDKALEEISPKKSMRYDSQVADACLSCFKKKIFKFK